MLEFRYTTWFSVNLEHLRACDVLPPPFHNMSDANGLVQRVYDKMLCPDPGLTRDDARKVIALWATPHSDSYGYQDFRLFLPSDLHKYIEGWAHDRHVNRGLDQFQSWITALHDLAENIYYGTEHDSETLARLPA